MKFFNFKFIECYLKKIFCGPPKGFSSLIDNARKQFLSVSLDYFKKLNNWSILTLVMKNVKDEPPNVFLPCLMFQLRSFQYNSQVTGTELWTRNLETFMGKLTVLKVKHPTFEQISSSAFLLTSCQLLSELEWFTCGSHTNAERFLTQSSSFHRVWIKLKLICTPLNKQHKQIK